MIKPGLGGKMRAVITQRKYWIIGDQTVTSEDGMGKGMGMLIYLCIASHVMMYLG